MANVRNLSLSFNGGELSPEMYARIDDQKYQFGVRKMSNFVATPQGPARKRFGSQYIAETKDSTKVSRLIAVNSSPTTVIEIGTDYFRFYENGQRVSYEYLAEDYRLPASVTFDIATGNVTFAAPHGYANNEPIGFSSSGNMPIFTSYSPISFFAPSGLYSTLVTAPPHKLIVNDPISRAQPTPTIGDPYFYAEPPAAYNIGTSFFLRNAAGSLVTPNTGGPATPGPFYHYISSIDTAVNPRQRSSRYYTDRVSSTVIKIRPIDGIASWAGFTTAGTGTVKCHKYYTVGQIVYWSNPGGVGQAAGFYQCISPTYAKDTGPELAKWTFKVNAPLDVANPVTYQESDIAELTYSQSNASILIAHKNYRTIELKRISQGWSANILNINSDLTPPFSVSASASSGPRLKITRLGSVSDLSTNPTVVTCSSLHGYVVGDYVYFRSTGVSVLDNNIWCVALPYNPGDSNRKDQFTVKACGLTTGFTNGTPLLQSDVSGGTGSPVILPADARVELWPDGSESSNTYTVTAINDDGTESEANVPGATIVNNIYQRGAFNTITWTPVEGAVRYRIYRQFNGLYGLIGETDGGSPQSFKDENVTPDFSLNPPRIDRSLEMTDEYPSAVAFYEQRAIYAGTALYPNKLWMTRSYTINDLGYRIPLVDTDRIAFSIANKEIQSIRHVVPLQDLIVLTDKSEYRVTSVNSDGITPASIYVRPQSFIGSGYQTPVIINNSLIFASARGGRLREAGFDSRAGGYVTGDISVRASHLFDNYTIKDLAYTRAPHPVVWAVSSTGKLLGFTYVPEERVGAWHQHNTDGVFESIAAAQDDESDYLYAIVRRTINGVSKRYVEKIQLSVSNDLPGARYLDCFASGSFTNSNQASTITLTELGLNGWDSGKSVQLSSALGVFSNADVGDRLHLTYLNNISVVVLITSVPANNQAIGTLVDYAPTSVRGVATSNWAWARDSYSGLSFLEGKTVGVVGDGKYIGDFTVSNGTVSLGAAYLNVSIGIKYDCELQTLPIAQQAEGLLQGRMKNVNKVWAKIGEAGQFSVGPRLISDKASAPAIFVDGSEETMVLIHGDWSNDGGVAISQTTPEPLILNGLTMEVSIGG